MPANRLFHIKIDKLTRSIENAISGDHFKTEVLELTARDIRRIKKATWVFNWKEEAKNRERIIFKLVNMVKEQKNIDFQTTGRQPFEQDFERISEWIRKKRQSDGKSKKQSGTTKLHSKKK